MSLLCSPSWNRVVTSAPWVLMLSGRWFNLSGELESLPKCYLLLFFFYNYALWLSSVQFSHSVMSNSLRPHGLQHARLPCPSPTSRVYSHSHPLSRWCHPTISSSVVPFSSCPQSFSASGFFKWVSSSHQAVKVLEFQLQHQSFQWKPRTDLL